MISTRMTSLFILCLSLISASTAVSNQKIYVKKSPSLASKVCDVALYGTTALFTARTLLRSMLCMCAMNAGSQESDSLQKKVIINFYIAALAAMAACCKNQWQEEQYVEVENQ